MIETVWENTNNKKIDIKIKNNEDSHLKFSDLMHKKQDTEAFHYPDKTVLGPKLSSKFISDKDLTPHLNLFKKNHQYNGLFLSKNNITDKGFNILCNHFKYDKSIKHFILAYNKIQFNEFAKAGLADLLKVNRHIGWLVLNNNEIENKGAINLATALNKNKSIIHMVLSNNKIGDLGLKEILNALIDHPKIESIFIANNKLTPVSINYLIDFILKNKTIKRIDISNNFNEDTSNLTQLIKITESKNIRLSI